MNNTKKVVSCLYTGILAANAERTITFGQHAPQNSPITFEVSEVKDKITITKVRINEKASSGDNEFIERMRIQIHQ